ncbi:ecto-ADP-ribosyltransferase 4-like isoform X1 [Gambusia affinis]|uniref:ecto-ADP-ribosyltransferase 4-like isoform X1 n=2 Tax=Gambusia affinis TaxID=33528 RepID=UPI001CDBFEF3|nr:ecto-ADP-ribosyltransferase 4-like isoform X1 [Gambusia affinis]XP_043969765.1 ecto-ADP-ribosyltransferase 4-like isoform X1 [Gambusia affinis]
MTFWWKSARGIKLLRNLVPLCGLLLVLVLLYIGPFLILCCRQRPAENAAVLPLDMAPDSIDDMYDGCRSKSLSLINLYGVFEWHVNKNFSYAWAVDERNAKKPVHKHLQDDHATSLYIFTKLANIRQDFNTAVKTGKHEYSTDRFRFHFLYFYLTDAIQALHPNHSACQTVFLRTWKRFEQDIVNTNVRFGGFTWAISSKQSFEVNGNVSCFEIQTCFGADITHYSSVNQMGQVLIPTYEVFRVTDVVTGDPWCGVVYKLQSTKKPKADQNCKLSQKLTKYLLGERFINWGGGNNVTMSACAVLLMINSFILVKRKQKCYVAVVLGAMIVLIIFMLLLN